MTPDYLTCEHELPIPKEVLDLMGSPPKWDEMELHTYSFLRTASFSDFDRYTISEDGQIYKEMFKTELVESGDELVIKDVPDGIERLDLTAEVLFCALHLDEEEDFYLQFKALFWKGEMKEIELEEWEKSDNKHRKNMQEQLKKQLEKQDEKEKSLGKKIKSAILWLVTPFFSLIRYVLGFIVRVTWNIERLFR
jgi:hypothetical protein